MFVEPEIESSYHGTGIGKTIYDYVRELAPINVIEFGSLHGYSAVCIGQALRDNGFGTLHCIDPWEEAKYGHGQDMRAVKERLRAYGLIRHVLLYRGDFNEYWESVDALRPDLVHIDINNTAEIFETITEYPHDFPVLFEGGSVERDNCWWMSKYKKEPMNPHKDRIPFRILNETFPSISVIEP